MEKSNTSTDLAMIPLAAHEAAMERAERNVRRWMIAFTVSVIFAVTTNLSWIARFC